MLEALRKKLKLDEDKLPITMERYGNTVSSSIPIAMHTLKSQGKLWNGQAAHAGWFWCWIFMGGMFVELLNRRIDE